MTSRRITIVASEILGRVGTGGAGTADSLLAVALGRNGHRVQLLVASGRDIGTLNDEWRRIYAAAGIELRVLRRRPRVEPTYLAPPLEVFHALRDDPPDVAVVNDWRGLGSLALRARQLGRALDGTAFVVHCHGTARVLAEFARKVPDTLERFGEEAGERASLELADAVVSPSAWLLDWMRAHGWPVPAAARVIPYVRHSAALGEPPPRAHEGAPVRRLAFFGQLREGKGVRILLAALEAVDPALLDGLELVFLGRETARWTGDRIEATLSSRLRERLAGIRLETQLDRDTALAELRRPGTLALMPSLLDNAPNTVSECIEHGVPFLAARTGGIPELVAEDDRDRVLFRPRAADLAAALTRALESRPGFAPAQPAADPAESLAAWLDVIETVTPPRRAAARAATAIAVVASSERSAERASRLATRTHAAELEVVRVSRDEAASATTAEWLVFLDDEDMPDDEVVDALVAAQAASGADVVTTAVRPAGDPSAIHLFAGTPGALGLAENQYGVLGLVRRSLVAGQPPLDGAVDPDWVLFARAALTGARIVSIPEPLATYAGTPGRVGDVPGDGLTVLGAFEELGGATLNDLPQLAATLAAAYRRLERTSASLDGARPSLVGRSLAVLRREGVVGLARRARARLR